MPVSIEKMGRGAIHTRMEDGLKGAECPSWMPPLQPKRKMAGAFVHVSARNISASNGLECGQAEARQGRRHVHAIPARNEPGVEIASESPMEGRASSQNRSRMGVRGPQWR